MRQTVRLPLHTSHHTTSRFAREFDPGLPAIGIGIDVIECARIQHSIERFGNRFLHRVFTDCEIEYSMSMKFPSRHLAARFAGKEAVAKAFGTGIRLSDGWRNIDIQKKPNGEPFFVFSAALCRRLGRSRRHSLSAGLVRQFE
jgi:holo-[acyl-carrier protein] synthase